MMWLFKRNKQIKLPTAPESKVDDVKHEFLRLARSSAGEAGDFLSRQKMDVGHRAMIKIVAKLASER